MTRNGRKTGKRDDVAIRYRLIAPICAATRDEVGRWTECDLTPTCDLMDLMAPILFCLQVDEGSHSERA